MKLGSLRTGASAAYSDTTMGVRDLEVAPLFTIQTRFCSKPYLPPHTARLSHQARASQSHTPAHAAGTLRAGAHAARNIRKGCIGSLSVATAFWPSLRDGGITSYATSLPPSLPSETSVCHQAKASPAWRSPSPRSALQRAPSSKHANFSRRAFLSSRV